MALSLTTKNREHYLEYIIEGEFEAKPNPPLLVYVMAQCKQYDIYNVLINVKAMGNYPSEESLLEMYDETLTTHDSFLQFDQKPIRMAVLTNAENLIEPHPGEKFSKGNAFSLKVSCEEEKALEWLLE